MENENKPEMQHHYHHGKGMHNGAFGGVYFLTIIGAAIYFIQHAAGFWGGVAGFLEALVWPVVVIYKVLELLKL